MGVLAGQLLRGKTDHPPLRPFVEKVLREEEIVAALLRRDLFALRKVLEFQLVHVETGGGGLEIEESEVHVA